MVGHEGCQRCPYHTLPFDADMVCTPGRPACAAVSPVAVAAEQKASRWIHWSFRDAMDTEMLWLPSQESQNLVVWRDGAPRFPTG